MILSNAKTSLKKCVFRSVLSFSLLCMFSLNSSAANQKLNNGTFDYWLIDENNTTLSSNDLINCVVIINGDDITVNLGAMTSPIMNSCIGIYIENKSNVTINGAPVQKFNTAVYVLNSDNITLNNIFCYSNNFGFRIENTYVCNINSGCDAEWNHYDAYLLINSQAVQLNNQTPYRNMRYGILDLGCIGTTIANGHVSWSGADGVYFGNSIAPYVTNYLAQRNVLNGMTLNSGTHSGRISGTTQNKTKFDNNSKVGLCISNSSGNTFTDCSGTGNNPNLVNNGNNNTFIRCSF